MTKKFIVQQPYTKPKNYRKTKNIQPNKSKPSMTEFTACTNSNNSHARYSQTADHNHLHAYHLAVPHNACFSPCKIVFLHNKW